MIMMSCVSVTSSILITDRLNHSESNFDLHKYEWKYIIMDVCHAY